MASQFKTGQLAVTGSAQQVSSTATSFSGGVKLTNLSSSSVSIFLGNSSSVTTSTGDELPVGQSVILPLGDLSSVYLIASGTGSTLSWLGIS